MESKINSVNCLICSVDNCRRDKYSKSLSDEKCSNLISNHLHVIFLLRNVLEVPTDKLMAYLRSDPQVESWISVCDNCEQMVTSCKNIYQNILTAQSQFRKVKQEIIQTLKESPLIRQDDDDEVVIATNIVEEIREFVYQNRYPETTDPFIYGDRVCREKLSENANDKVEDKLFWTANSFEDDEIEDELEELFGEKEDDLKKVASSNPLSPESPLSLPMTIDLDGDDHGSGDGVYQDPDADFDPNDDMDMDNPDQNEDDEWKPTKTEKQPRRPRKQKTLPKPTTNSDDTFSCPICDKTFPTFAEGANHFQSLHFAPGKKAKDKPKLSPKKVESKSKTCDICKQVFTTWVVCQRHREFVHEKKWKCSKCGVVKWTKGHLEKHKLICSLEKSWTCPVSECGLVYETVGALKIHVGRLHKDHKEKIKGDEDEDGEGPPPLIICESCGATYKKRNHLAVHRSTSVKCRKLRGLEVRKKDPVICQHCGKSYLNKRALHLHNRTIHEKRFSKWCDLCGMGFLGPRGLERHLWGKHKIGEGDKSWRCEVEGCTAQICGEKQREAHMRSRHGIVKAENN